MEVSSQHHGPVALPPWTDPPVQFECEAGGASELLWALSNREASHFLPASKRTAIPRSSSL